MRTGIRLTYRADTTATVTQLYKPWGETRYASGTLPTDYTFTGPAHAHSHTDDFGLMYYNARWYDPALGRMAQADTIVPGAGNPMAWDRYAYAMNSPVSNVDPSGHRTCTAEEAASGDETCDQNIEEESGDCLVNCTQNEDNDNDSPEEDPTPPDFLVTWFNVVLTPHQLADLLAEINWWLDKADNTDDIATLLEALGLGAEVLTAAGAIVPELGIPVGVALFGGGAILDWTVGDLETLRYNLAMYSEGGTQSIRLSMGANIEEWGIAVNGETVVSHLNVSPVFTPKGIWNLTPTFMLSWYYFDLQYK